MPFKIIENKNTMSKIIEGLKNGINQDSDLVINQTKNRVPVDTGNLKSSIKQQDNTMVMDGYGIYVEMGTRHSAPQPFIKDSIKAATNEMIQKMIEEQRKSMRGL